MTVLTTLACTINANGIAAPAFADVLQTLQSQYQGIYGSDIVLDNSTKDGQWLGILATMQNDQNAACVAAFNSFSPATAQGVGLSRVVKINGIARLVPSNSTCDVVIIGTVGVQIINGAVSDGTNQWNLPASVTIPSSGTITVTTTCAVAGAISAAANTLTIISTPTRNWNSVNNPNAATLGFPVESDAALRSRQSISTANPSSAISDGIIGAVAALAGVLRVAYFENNTDSTDSRGIPSHSFSLVVDGGDATQIATAIALRKSPGAGTYGTTAVTVVSAAGIPQVIRFYRPTQITILTAIDLTALTGYATSTGVEIQTAVSAYLNALPIGSPVYWTRLFHPGNLEGTNDGQYYDITGLRIARSPSTPTAANITLLFYEAAQSVPANVTLNVS